MTFPLPPLSPDPGVMGLPATLRRFDPPPRTPPRRSTRSTGADDLTMHPTPARSKHGLSPGTHRPTTDKQAREPLMPVMLSQDPSRGGAGNGGWLQNVAPAAAGTAADAQGTAEELMPLRTGTAPRGRQAGPFPQRLARPAVPTAEV